MASSWPSKSPATPSTASLAPVESAHARISRGAGAGRGFRGGRESREQGGGRGEGTRRTFKPTPEEYGHERTSMGVVVRGVGAIRLWVSLCRTRPA